MVTNAAFAMVASAGRLTPRQARHALTIPHDVVTFPSLPLDADRVRSGISLDDVKRNQFAVGFDCKLGDPAYEE